MENLKRVFAKTKVICTLGPVSSTSKVIAHMVRAGMGAARLNFSHGTHEEHLVMLQNLRLAADETGEPISIIQDLQGPKIRIGELATKTIELKMDQLVTITTQECVGDATRFSTTYQHLPGDVRPGDRVLLDDGKVELRVQ